MSFFSNIFRTKLFSMKLSAQDADLAPFGGVDVERRVELHHVVFLAGVARRDSNHELLFVTSSG